jgi:hypothetical protein
MIPLFHSFTSSGEGNGRGGESHEYENHTQMYAWSSALEESFVIAWEIFKVSSKSIKSEREGRKLLQNL